jgi:hypothetical protein
MAVFPPDVMARAAAQVAEVIEQRAIDCKLQCSDLSKRIPGLCIDF